jgi:hypothetical protein
MCFLAVGRGSPMLGCGSAGSVKPSILIQVFWGCFSVHPGRYWPRTLIRANRFHFTLIPTIWRCMSVSQHYFHVGSPKIIFHTSTNLLSLWTKTGQKSVRHLIAQLPISKLITATFWGTFGMFYGILRFFFCIGLLFLAEPLTIFRGTLVEESWYILWHIGIGFLLHYIYRWVVSSTPQPLWPLA